jgi:acetylornithine deacetylase
MPVPTLSLNSKKYRSLSDEAIQLLKQLIAIPSFSREEDLTADLLFEFLKKRNVPAQRLKNNIWATNKYYDPNLPTILLNSHHDTVKPNASYTKDPFHASEIEGKLYGLGSNDAGGALVSLLSAFLFFYETPQLRYNLIFAATAEEEISGHNGVELLLPKLGNINFAIVGEPTGMHLAVAEKGLMVLDCISYGTSAHAAHTNPDNAINNALPDLEWFRTYTFKQTSELLGEIKMNVTMIKAGIQHNVIPDKCEFTIDVRTTDALNNQQVLDIVKQHVHCEVKPRSLRLNPSSISLDHPFVKAAMELGRNIYGSPTISDQALMNFESVKIGPGESKRSHSSDEFIFISEVEEGIDIYIQLLAKLLK